MYMYVDVKYMICITTLNEHENGTFINSRMNSDKTFKC